MLNPIGIKIITPLRSAFQHEAQLQKAAELAGGLHRNNPLERDLIQLSARGTCHNVRTSTIKLISKNKGIIRIPELNGCVAAVVRCADKGDLNYLVSHQPVIDQGSLTAFSNNIGTHFNRLNISKPPDVLLITPLTQTGADELGATLKAGIRAHLGEETSIHPVAYMPARFANRLNRGVIGYQPYRSTIVTVPISHLSRMPPSASHWEVQVQNESRIPRQLPLR
jgi:hypothetical protein